MAQKYFVALGVSDDGLEHHVRTAMHRKIQVYSIYICSYKGTHSKLYNKRTLIKLKFGIIFAFGKNDSS